MTVKCPNCSRALDIERNVTVECPRCGYWVHVFVGPHQDASDYLLRRPTMESTYLISRNAQEHFLGWYYKEVQPIRLRNFSSLFEKGELADVVARTIQDGLGLFIKMPITIDELDDRGEGRMLPSVNPPKFCACIWKDPEKRKNCENIAAGLAREYLGRYRHDPRLASIGQPRCWLMPFCRHIVRLIFVNDKAVAVAASGRMILDDEWDPSVLDKVPVECRDIVEKEMVCPKEEWKAREEAFSKVVDTISRIATDRYLLERHERDSLFFRETEALYSASLSESGPDQARDTAERILKRVTQYFGFQYGLWIELHEKPEKDDCHNEVVVTSIVRNPDLLSVLPAPKKEKVKDVAVPVTESDINVLFAKAVRQVREGEPKAAVFQKIKELITDDDYEIQIVVLVPVTSSSMNSVTLVLVNHSIKDPAGGFKKYVSDFGIEALRCLQLSLIQEQRHQESLSQAGFILDQVGHELAMATEGILQKGILLTRHINNPDRRRVYLNNVTEELQLLGALRDKIVFCNSLLQGPGLKPRRNHIGSFYKEVIRPKANLMTRRASARTVVIDFQRHVDMSRRPFQSDKGLLGQVFLNMLDNAVKYSHWNTHITVSSGFDRGILWFEVSNEGIGIPSGEEKYIFLPSTRGSNAGKFSQKGSGIGVYVSKEIMKLLGGDLELKCSDESPGRTVFRAWAKVRLVREQR